MKYKVGDKVKYDSGEWLFYGTVTAVMDNAISPCYRFSVDRMVKQNCKFSITQFEFELNEDSEVESVPENSKWDNAEIEYLTKNQPSRGKKIKSGEVKPDTVTVPQPQPQPQPQPVESLPPTPEITTARKQRKRESWETYFELYQKDGKRNVSMNNWIAQNRRQYRLGQLKEDRFEKLVQINFPFEAQRKVNQGTPKEKKAPIAIQKPDIWDKQLEQWKRGDDRRSLQAWRDKNIKRYVAGKLSSDRIEKLKAVGILQ